MSLPVSVACPSCEKPFVIQVPAAAPANEYIPLADDPPVPKRSARSSDPSISGVSSSSVSGLVKMPSSDAEDIPLLDDEPSRPAARSGSGSLESPSKSGTKRSDSKSDTGIRERRKGESGENIRPRSDSKTVKFASQTQSAEFEAMLADSSGTDLFDDDDSKPQPPKQRRGRTGGKSEANVETTEF